MDNTLLPRIGTATILTLDQIRQIRQETELSRAKTSKSGQFITKFEYEKMKGTAIFESQEQIEAKKRILSEQQAQQREVAKARRDRIIKSELLHKTQRINSTRPVNLVKVDSIQTRAQAVLDERDDVCKTMNAMMLYSRVATIRDL